MNKKERIIAAIELKDVDRIPSTFRASDCLAKKLMDHFAISDPQDFGKNHAQLLQHLKADYWSTGTKLDKFSILLPKYKGSVPKDPYMDDGNYFYTIGIRSKKATMAAYQVDYPNIGVEPPLSDIGSTADLKPGFLTSKLDLFEFDKMQNRYGDVAASGDDIVCLGTLTSLFMICCYLRGMENFLMDLVFNKKMAEALIDEVGAFCIEFNKRELASAGSKAMYYGTWDDVAGQDGMMFDPALFKKYFLPIYKKLIDNNKKYGLFFGFHVCGSIHEVMPMLIDAGIDVFDVVQTSAKDMDLENIYRLYGKSVCLHGGLDIQKLLVEGTLPRVREEVKKIKHLWSTRGGIILAPTHLTLPDTPVENILAVYDELSN